jgi:hypothetical protein
MNDASASSSVCAEKQPLVAAHDVATNAFAAAVTNLHELIGTSAKSEYSRLRQTVDEARLGSEQARLALEGHIETHQC